MKLLETLNLSLYLLLDTDLVYVDRVHEFLKLFDQIRLIDIPTLTLAVFSFGTSIVHVAVYIAIFLLLELLISADTRVAQSTRHELGEGELFLLEQVLQLEMVFLSITQV